MQFQAPKTIRCFIHHHKTEARTSGWKQVADTVVSSRTFLAMPMPTKKVCRLRFQIGLWCCVFLNQEEEDHQKPSQYKKGFGWTLTFHVGFKHNRTHSPFRFFSFLDYLCKFCGSNIHQLKLDHVNFVFRFQLFQPVFMFIFFNIFKVHAFMFKKMSK